MKRVIEMSEREEKQRVV